ncbi:MAG: PDZ domain-containing protein [Thermoguttaceae bacterium]
MENEGAMRGLAVGMLKVLVAVIVLGFMHHAMISLAMAAGDLDSLEQKAINDAVDRVAPSVVRIETIGGLEEVENVHFGAGPTTGLVIDPEGYIVSSAFAFSNKPASIIVRLADGTRKPAKLVATDHVRMIVLLKIDADKPLPVCEIVPSSEMRVGQWTIALGRTFEGDRPNVSVGILSAKDRIWGKAIQTDAAVSPNNYGGPLVDIRGRVMGLIAPLSPESADEVAGYEWYDSGIGFAIPADHIQKILPRLKKGEDLRQGFVGVSMQSQNVYISEPVIGVCHVKSPAAEAGLKPGDRIVEVEGRKISRSAEFREEIYRRYAGDKIELAVLRGKERLERELTLVEKIPAYQRPFLGVLPMRGGGEAGVKIRYVFPDGPAAKAGIIAGDAVLSIDGKAVNKREDLIEALLGYQSDQPVDLEVLHEGKNEHRKFKLGSLNESTPPAVLPAACEKQTPGEAKGLETGKVKLKIAEFPNDAFAYVPENYDPNVPYGLVVWLHGDGGLDWAKAVASWKPLCERYDLILAAPKSGDTKKWTPRDVDLVNQMIAQIKGKYNVDPLRVVVHGYETGGTLASFISFRNREIIRAMAVVDAPLSILPPESDPQYRFEIYLAMSGKSPAARSLKKILPMLREKNIPLIEKKLGDEPRYLNSEELAELARWIDMLDRI